MTEGNADSPNQAPRTPHVSTAINRFRAFARSHNRLLTFVGALIVFFTFVIKEGLREHLKDLVDSIDSAQTFYTVRSDSQNLSAKLSDLQQHLADLEDEVSSRNNKSGDGSQDDPAIRTGAVKSALDALEVSLDNMSHLAGKLPEAPTYEKTIAALQQKIDQTYSTLEEDVSSQEGLDEFRQTPETEIEARARLLSHQVDSAASALLQDAGKEQARREHYFEVCTWISYGLYVIGWGVGLLGRILGVGELDIGA